MKGKRVFVGFPANETLIERVNMFRREHAGLNVRWIRPENLHVTVVSPWQCSSVEMVCRQVQEVSVRQGPFMVHFDQVSFGPEKSRPRLVWATGATPSGMVDFAMTVCNATGNGNSTSASFLLHLTIARFNGHDLRTMGINTFSEPVTWQGMLDSICLYESRLKPSGAEYLELCRFTLPGTGRVSVASIDGC
jgi:2'-5' RNA ligase